MFNSNSEGYILLVNFKTILGQQPFNNAIKME